MKNSALDAIVGNSRKILQIKKLVEKISRHTSVPVLITGETGTGKELVANALHECSENSGKDMVRINCSAIPGELMESTLFGHKKGAFTGATQDSIGLVESANGGTLFLDEISELDFKLQPKLLRFLENGTFRRLGEIKERHVETWGIAATNRDLKQEVGYGRFRQDLYYRLKGHEIVLPPLRERKHDISLLIQHFCSLDSKSRSELIFEPMVLEMFLAHDWPGNVRELRQLVNQLMALSDGKKVTTKLLPVKWNIDGNIQIPSVYKTLKEIEYEYICDALEITNYQMIKTAELLGLHRTTLYRKIRELNIPVSFNN